MRFKTFDDIERVAKAGKPDSVLDSFIESYLQREALLVLFAASAGIEVSESEFRDWVAEQIQNDMLELPDVDVAAFRSEYYSMFRAGAYPPIEMYLDAQVKGDDVQRQKYIDLCVSVKARFPKG